MPPNAPWVRIWRSRARIGLPASVATHHPRAADHGRARARAAAGGRSVAEQLAGDRAQAQWSWAERRPGPVSTNVAGMPTVAAIHHHATRSPCASRKPGSEFTVLLRLEHLDGQVIRIERAGYRRSRRRGAGIGGGAVQLRKRDVLFVDGHAQGPQGNGRGRIPDLTEDDSHGRIPRNGTDGLAAHRKDVADVVRGRATRGVFSPAMDG